MDNVPKTIKNPEYLAEGKRSIVYVGYLNSQKVSIKTTHPKSDAKGRISNEAKFLMKLNKYGIGPTLLSKGKNYIVYKFVEGILFIDYLEKNPNSLNIIKKILEQCRVLDKLKINKLEFTRPIKHIFIKNNKVTIIDYERCYETENPKNVTQFCQFLMRKNSEKYFKINKLEFREILKKYKDNQTDENFKKIIKFLKLSFSSSS
jgi:putative serine/threonine protein kinase